jgi:hypothetical protein
MTTIEETRLPALTAAEHGALNNAFRLPDVSAIPIEALDDESLVHFVTSFEAQRKAATLKFAALCAPIDDAIAQGRHLVKERIRAAGASEMASDTFFVRLQRSKGKRNRFVDVLRKLVGLVPAEELSPALWIDAVDVSQAPPEAVEAVLLAGGKAEWNVDLRKLDSIAKRYGGEIARLIAEGSPRGEDGPEELVIEPRPAALKVAS